MLPLTGFSYVPCYKTKVQHNLLCNIWYNRLDYILYNIIDHIKYVKTECLYKILIPAHGLGIA